MSTKIDQAFIDTFINASFGLEIAHENLPDEPTAGTEYAELINLPNDTTALSLNDLNETDGLFRINLYWPVNKGSIAPKAKADEILAIFTIGTTVCYDSQCATVDSVSREKGATVDNWYKTIITIGYYASISY